MENSELRKQWELRIAAFRSSGLTQAKWCEANQLKLHQLKYWLKRIEVPSSKTNSAPSFAPLLIEEPKQSDQDTLQVKIGNISIEVKPGFDPSLFADVVKVLKTVC
ncbi:IS66 family insertion sequence element accessory protein TnpA [Heyndrickxia acidiproducens]|uniref:IS66 family insertion sequence element accessory protein TnpA n=1 Tax=Heyndrickxia acidiproducens TaxID=1121084 RepID=UPI00036378FD|nr:hypothetical protein [Heyndrickxia acidiproducens]